jgi:hypothetical protein
MMDGIIDPIMLKKHKTLDEDTLRYELRVRGYTFDKSNGVMQAVKCLQCGHIGLKGEAWQKPTVSQKSKKVQMVHYSFYYCAECGRVGVHG